MIRWPQDDACPTQKRCLFVRPWAAIVAVTLISVFVGSCGGGSGSSGGSGNQPSLMLFANPSTLTLGPGSNLVILITASTTNTSALPSVTLDPLPPGLSTTTVFPLTIGASGASLALSAATTATAGPYTVTLHGTAGTGVFDLPIPVTVASALVPFGFATPVFNEVQAPAGGAGTQQFISLSTTLGGNTVEQYNVSLSVSGLPPGTAAVIQPNVIVPGQSGTVTISAAANAQPISNVVVTLTGTPSAPTPPATMTFLLDVTPATGAVSDNRTDYLSTEGSPFSAVYDPALQLIFSSNPAWNRVDVISNVSHKIMKEIPIPDPRGVDISIDGSRVWVATNSQQVFEINTTTLAATRHLLPTIGQSTPTGAQIWQGKWLYALSDGTVMLFFGQANNAFTYFTLWDPASNILTPLRGPNNNNASVGIAQRTGDGTKVFAFSGTSVFYYDVVTQSFSGVVQLPQLAGDSVWKEAVNVDGSRVAVTGLSSGTWMYDGNFNLVGAVPGGGFGGAIYNGGMIFSNDDLSFYELCMPFATPVIYTIDPNSLTVRSVAPAMPFIPVMTELGPPFFRSTPFAADSTGMVLGMQDYGIDFDDATFTPNLDPQIATPVFLQHMSPYSGPIAGGTLSGGFGNAFSIIPSVWYGASQGSAGLSTNSLSITSPPGNAPGPVNVKMQFPDGIEIFDPLFFSYGPYLTYAVLSGASPDGGAPGIVAGYGMPSGSYGAGTGTLTVGGGQANINASSTIPALYGYPFPVNIDQFTVPAGVPGPADIKVTTPAGTSTLPKAFFYAQSVKDYSSPDTFTAILYDRGRQQLYLSATDHIDVFSLSSNQFGSPLIPAALGSSKQFTGLALSPDGSQLLATDLLDGSLSVINPDTSANTYAIPIAQPVPTGQPGCSMIGPLYVASMVNNQAFVATGGLPGPGCGSAGGSYSVNLGTRTAVPSGGFNCLGSAYGLSGTNDGTKILYRCEIYDAVNQSYSLPIALGAGFPIAISNDGNVAAQYWEFADSSGNSIGRVASPDI